jgi:hypothetical protein
MSGIGKGTKGARSSFKSRNFNRKGKRKRKRRAKKKKKLTKYQKRLKLVSLDP